MMGAQRPFLLNRQIPSVAGPENAFKKAEDKASMSSSINEKNILKKQYDNPTAGVGPVKPALSQGANPVDEAMKPLEKVPEPGAMAQVDPEIQKEAQGIQVQLQRLSQTKDQAIMQASIKANLDFVAKLQKKFQEARDSLQDPALAEKYKNMIDDHLAMNDTLQSILGPGAIERISMS
jgi:hypothetical protein